MSTNWLITWNPAKWQWPGDMLPKISRRSMSGEIIAGDQSWSVSNTRRVQLGDKVYLMRQGRNQPGLVASGVAYGSPYPGDHWNESGDSTNYIDIAWTAIIDPDTHPPLPRDELKTGITDHVNWSTQRSGISIDNAHPEAAHELEKKWEAHLHQVWGKAPGMEQRTREAKEQAVPWRAFNTCRQLFEKEDWQGVIDILTELAESNPFEKFHILLGDAHYGKDEYEKAIEAYTEAIKISPQNLYVLSQRATGLEELGKIAEAEKDYDEIVRRAPEDADAWLNLSFFHCRNENEKKAIDAINEALRVEPENDLLLYQRTSIYSSLGEYEKAIEDYDNLLRIDPGDTEVLIERGDAYVAWDKYEKALEDYEEAIRLDPENAQAFNQRGLAYFYIDDYDKALQDFSSAVELCSDFDLAYYNRGYTHQVLDEHTKAIEDFTKTLEIDQENGNASNMRGLSYIGIGEFDKAIVDFENFISLAPDDPEAYNNRGFAYQEKGEFGNAIVDFEEAILLDPEYALAYYNLSCSYFKLGETDEAKRALEKANSIDPLPTTEPLQDLAEAFFDKEQYDEAIACLDLAIANAPDPKESAVLYFGRACIHKVTGELAAAIQDNLKASELDPEDPFICNALGKLYQSMDEVAKAEEYLSKAEELGYTEEEDDDDEGDPPEGEDSSEEADS